MHKTPFLILAFGACVLAAGCEVGRIRVPAEFVEVSQSMARPYEMRAISADGVVIGYRTAPNAKQGTLAFWSTAVREKLEQDMGYEVFEARDVRSDSGLAGRLFRAGCARSGAAYTYLLALYVTGNTIHRAEAGGRSEDLEPRMEEVTEALTSL